MQYAHDGQLSLFEHAAGQHENTQELGDIKGPIATQSAFWQLYIDGAARRNPGPAGAGVYILKDGMPFFQDGYYLGEQTNNQAEYMSLLVGLYFVEQWKQPHDKLSIFSDSQLLIRQIQGHYRVRNAALMPKHKLAVHWVKALKASVGHIPREENTHADAMANKGIDFKKALPQAFITRLHNYEAALR